MTDTLKSGTLPFSTYPDPQIPIEEWETSEFGLGYRFEVLVSAGEQCAYIARVARLPGVHSQGDDLESVLNNIGDALQGCLSSYAENDQEIPYADTEPKRQDERLFGVIVNV